MRLALLGHAIAHRLCPRLNPGLTEASTGPLRGRCHIVRHNEGMVVVAVPGEQNQAVPLRLLVDDAREEAPPRLDSAT